MGWFNMKRLSRLVQKICFAMIIVMHTGLFGMLSVYKTKPLPKRRPLPQALQGKLTVCKENKFWIYTDNDKSKGICVSQDVLRLSNTLKNSIQDISEIPSKVEKAIPIPFNLTTIQKSFTILGLQQQSVSQQDIDNSITKTANEYDIEQFVDVFNCLHYLDCPAVEKGLLATLQNKIIQSNQRVTNIHALKNLNIDLLRTWMAPFCSQVLKNSIIQRYAQERSSILQGHPDAVRVVAWNPDGNSFVSGCNYDQDNLILWDKNGNQIKSLQGHPNDVRVVAWNPDGNSFVSGCDGNQNNLILWDKDGNNPKILQGHPNDVWVVAWSPDGNSFVSGCRSVHNNNLILWDKDGNKIKSLQGHPDIVEVVAWSPDGNSFVSGYWSTQNNLILWDKDGNQIKSLQGHPDTVEVVAWSPDGNFFVSGYLRIQNNLILWDKDGNQIKSLQGHPGIINTIAWNPDANFFVSGCWGTHNNLILWKLFTDQDKAALEQIDNCSSEQLLFLYDVCLNQDKKIPIKFSEIKSSLFAQLPDNLRNLLINVLIQEHSVLRALYDLWKQATQYG